MSKNKNPNVTLLQLAFVILVHQAISVCCTRYLAKDDYWVRREEIIAAEASQELGASIELMADELIANEILMELKLSELDASFYDPGKYIPSRHFFDTQKEISQNKLFAILREMPKGAVLHTHFTATTNWDFLYKQTFRDYLYICNAEPPRLRFFEVPDFTCDWKLLRALRDEIGEEFEDYLIKHLTLVREHHYEEYTDINKVWSAFQNIFDFVMDMLTYKPVFEANFYATLEQLYNDNITYVEFRSSLPTVYNLDGTTYSEEDIIQTYIDIENQFKKEHPNFIGAKLIYTPRRILNDMKIEEYLDIAKRIKRKFPNYVAGFDLAGQEDLGRPLVDFIDMLRTSDLDFYFHAGETNWNQGVTDQNLIDAILLGTKRIGHAYALIKHPELMKIVKEKQIALEISPISNQVLGLVKDLRNHPASVYMATNMPIVISNDDPTYWGAEGVSYDWYMAFMGLSSRQADLRLLKQLAYNSLKYSSLNPLEKLEAVIKWERQWNMFIKRFIITYQKL